MAQRFRNLKSEPEGGFTLIELLIVIVVLGILAGIVVLGLGAFKEDATTAACNADVKQVQIASDAYIASPSNTTGAPAASIAALVTAKLLKSEPPAGTVTYNAVTGDATLGTC